jgi:hypothetical protein
MYFKEELCNSIDYIHMDYDRILKGADELNDKRFFSLSVQFLELFVKEDPWRLILIS